MIASKQRLLSGGTQLQPGTSSDRTSALMDCPAKTADQRRSDAARARPVQSPATAFRHRGRSRRAVLLLATRNSADRSGKHRGEARRFEGIDRQASTSANPARPKHAQTRARRLRAAGELCRKRADV